MKKESMPEGYSREIDEHPEDISHEEIAHDEEINDGWKQKDDSAQVLLREKALIKERSLSSLRLDLKNIWAEKAILVNGEEEDQDSRKLKETRTRLCNEYIKEIGQDNIERVLDDTDLSLEDKGKILANLNVSLNKGLCLRFDSTGRTDQEQVMYRRENLIENPQMLGLAPEKIKIERENMIHVIEGWAIGQLITGDVDLAVDDLVDIARLRGLGKEGFHEMISKKIKYFEKARQSSKELESSSNNLKNLLLRFDDRFKRLGYNWDEQSEHYVRSEEGKK